MRIPPVQFRLIYQGTLLADNGRRVTPARADKKHEIRKLLHPQLKRLWDVHPYLKRGQTEIISDGRTVEFGAPRAANTIPALARRYSDFGYRFVPLITADLQLTCELDVLFLRTDPPGSLFSAGDIDNRMKTLFDGLLVPKQVSQLGSYTVPGPDEDPFFCLLEDDSLITKVSIETDTLLLSDADPTDARVIIKVTVKPYSARPDTLGLA